MVDCEMRLNNCDYFLFAACTCWFDAPLELPCKMWQECAKAIVLPILREPVACGLAYFVFVPLPEL